VQEEALLDSLLKQVQESKRSEATFDTTQALYLKTMQFFSASKG
jgi:hypothetical protein